MICDMSPKIKILFAHIIYISVGGLQLYTVYAFEFLNHRRVLST